MILAEHLHNVDRHWAVLAVGEAERDRGLKVANARLVKRAVGQQMLIDFPEDGADDDLLHSLAMAYEMAAIEGLDAFLNPTYDDEELRKQCSAGDAQMEVLLRWLQAASRQMVAGSLWWVARAVNSRVARFVSDATKQALFELFSPPPLNGRLYRSKAFWTRPLALIILDEAHNIEDETRGLRIELLLATVRRECSTANFLLLMPYVEKAETLVRWLAQDVSGGRTISFGTTPWKPNERIVGMFHAEADDSRRAGWQLNFRTLITTPGTIHLEGEHKVGQVRPLEIPKSRIINTKTGQQKGVTMQAAAMAKVLSEHGTSIAVANNTDHVWSMARHVSESFEPLKPIPAEIRLVQDFLRTEISTDFELIHMLSRGVGVHHAGLSDEVRTLNGLPKNQG